MSKFYNENAGIATHQRMVSGKAPLSSVVNTNISQKSSIAKLQKVDLSEFKKIQIPQSMQQSYSQLLGVIEQGSGKPSHWWDLVHFLSRCKLDPDQMLSIIEKVCTKQSQKDKTDRQYAKLYIAQCKYLTMNSRHDDAVRLFKGLERNGIGRDLYYFWIGYAKALVKVDRKQTALKVLEKALARPFVDGDRNRIKTTYIQIQQSLNEDNEDNESMNQVVDIQTPKKTNTPSTPSTPHINDTSDFDLGSTPASLFNISSQCKKVLSKLVATTTTPTSAEIESQTSSDSSDQLVPQSTSALTITNAAASSPPPQQVNEEDDEEVTPPTPTKCEPSVLQKTCATPAEADISNATSNDKSEASTSTQSVTEVYQEPNPTPTVPTVSSTPVKASYEEIYPATAADFSFPEFTVHGKKYHFLGLMGQGGSARVLKALGWIGNEQSRKQEIFAIKQVDISNQDLDQQTLLGLQNEISHLASLRGKRNIVMLYDYEITSKKLSLVLEMGDIDLRQLLRQTKNAPLDMVTVRVYWQQMLESVQVIHEQRIVHADLKPANFVSFKGTLKLIDFGIAGAIHSNTTSLKRDSMIGTINYIAPEALQYQNAKIKLGCASDIWSLGIILYEMIYHTTPFASITNGPQKIQAIISDQFAIPFPPIKNQCALEVMKACLQRDPTKRPTTDELLAHKFLSC